MTASARWPLCASTQVCLRKVQPFLMLIPARQSVSVAWLRCTQMTAMKLTALRPGTLLLLSAWKMFRLVILFATPSTQSLLSLWSSLSQSSQLLLSPRIKAVLRRWAWLSAKWLLKILRAVLKLMKTQVKPSLKVWANCTWTLRLIFLTVPTVLI